MEYKRQYRDLPDEVKKRISASTKGRAKSYDHKQHISQGMKRYWDTVITFDKLKMVVGLGAIKSYDGTRFEATVKNGKTSARKYYQEYPFLLKIKLDYKRYEAVIEFSGKILGKDYPLSQQRVLTGLYESMQGQPERLESELTQLAYDKMMGYDGTRPGDYESRYRPQIDELLAQIAGREGFSYDPAEDPLYRSMRDQYLRLGNRAMQDTMAQAAGLTGGYGNSYAAGAGQQAYQDYLSGLNGQLPNLYQLAYQQYRDELGDKYDQLSALSGLDATDYSRFRDLVGDWETDRDWWTQRYDRESGMDMTRYEQDLAAWQADRDWWYKLLDKMQDPLEMARAGASGGGSGGGGGRTAKVDPMLRSGGKEFESVKTKGTPSSAGLPSTGMVGTGGMTEAELRAALLAQGYNLDEVDAYVAGQKQTGIPLFDVSGVPDKQGQIVVPAGGGTTGGTTGKVTLPIDASTGGGAEVFGMYGTGLDPAQLEELARQYGISPNK